MKGDLFVPAKFGQHKGLREVERGDRRRWERAIPGKGQMESGPGRRVVEQEVGLGPSDMQDPNAVHWVVQKWLRTK